MKQNPDHNPATTRLASPVALAAMSVLAVFSAAAQAQCGEPGEPIVHEFIVRILDGETIEDVASSYGAVILGSYPSRSLYLLGTPAPDPDEETEIELEIDDRLESHEQNSVNAIAEGHTQSFFVRTAASNYPTQPTGTVLRLSQVQQMATGAGVTVAVLDTGIWPHSSLEARIAAGGFNFITGTAASDDTSPGLQAGHGTFVAGLIHLVAPQADLLPIAVLDGSGKGTSFTVAQGIYHAIDQGVGVINLSLSSPADSPAVRDAIATARAQGIVVVASVGNTGSSVPSFPAANAGVIAVAATDVSDHAASFTDYGLYVSLCAPGVGLVSLLPEDDFGEASGTSFSAAVVSGTAALVGSRFATEGSNVLTQRLDRTALDVGPLNPTMYGLLGAGRVRPFQALLRTKPGLATSGPR